jgi:hypothetical protein
LCGPCCVQLIGWTTPLHAGRIRLGDAAAPFFTLVHYTVSSFPRHVRVLGLYRWAFIVVCSRRVSHHVLHLCHASTSCVSLRVTLVLRLDVMCPTTCYTCVTSLCCVSHYVLHLCHVSTLCVSLRVTLVSRLYVVCLTTCYVTVRGCVQELSAAKGLVLCRGDVMARGTGGECISIQEVRKINANRYCARLVDLSETAHRQNRCVCSLQIRCKFMYHQ